MKDNRKRKRFNFWLDDKIRSDRELINNIKDLKDERNFTQAIRDGLRLIPSLMRGDTHTLFEMFPVIKDKLYAQMEADILERLGVERDTEVIQHIIELKGVISQIKNQPVLSAPMQGNFTMRRVTTEEEIKLNVVRDESHNPDVAQNFVNSLGALNATQPMKVISQPKQLSVPQVAAPSFDDDDDDLFN